MWWLASLLSASLSCGIQSLYCSLSSNCTPDRMLLSASAQSCWLETQGCRKCLNCVSKCVGVCICVFVCVRKSDRKGGRASCTGGRGGLLLRARFSWESWELRMWGLKRDASGLSMKACSVFAKEMIFLLFFFLPLVAIYIIQVQGKGSCYGYCLELTGCSVFFLFSLSLKTVRHCEQQQ